MVGPGVGISSGLRYKQIALGLKEIPCKIAF